MLSHFLWFSPLRFFSSPLSWGCSGLTGKGQKNLIGVEVGLGIGGILSMSWSQKAECSTNSGQQLSLRLYPFPHALGFTKGHSAVMSPPGHRVSQLSQRLPDILRREGLKGQTSAACSPNSCYVSQPWVSQLLQKPCKTFLIAARALPKWLQNSSLGLERLPV